MTKSPSLLPATFPASESATSLSDEFITSLSDPEAEAWKFIWDLSVEAILEATPLRVVQKIKPAVRALFQDCCAVALRKIHEDPSNESAWKLFFLIPHMVLRPLARGGKHGMGDLKATYNKFLNWRWEELVNPHELSRKKASYGSQETRRAAALRLVRCGELSRASKVLTSKGLAPDTEDTIKKLASKHSSRSENVIPPTAPGKDSVSLSKSLWFDLLEVQVLAHQVGDLNTIKHLLKMKPQLTISSTIAKGALPIAAVKLLSSSRLIALPKSNGDVRPIAIGECLRRLTARAICVQMKEEFGNFFSPIQHGVSTPNGSELIIHHIDLILQQNPNWIAMKTDIKNAFNSASRQHLFPELSSHGFQMYGSSSFLIFMQGTSPVFISSEEGVHQGDPLGPALFATAIHPALKELQKHHPTIDVLAYLDDVFLLGSLEDILAAFLDLREAFSALSLAAADHKCEIFSPSASTVVSDAGQIPVKSS